MIVNQPIPDGHIASIVTFLEMHKLPPAPDDGQGTSRSLTLEAMRRPALDWYVALFRQIGEDWLWFSRLVMRPEQLSRIVHNDNVAVYALRENGRDIGLLELDWRERPDCEISFFGLVPEAIGGGNGAWLMRQAQEIAFGEGASRLWLHTCTLDHPKALPFYLRHGFHAFRREVEIAPDPRLSGNVGREAADFHPIIAARANRTADQL